MQMCICQIKEEQMLTLNICYWCTTWSGLKHQDVHEKKKGRKKDYS